MQQRQIVIHLEYWPLLQAQYIVSSKNIFGHFIRTTFARHYALFTSHEMGFQVFILKYFPTAYRAFALGLIAPRNMLLHVFVIYSLPCTVTNELSTVKLCCFKLIKFFLFQRCCFAVRTEIKFLLVFGHAGRTKNLLTLIAFQRVLNNFEAKAAHEVAV